MEIVPSSVNHFPCGPYVLTTLSHNPSHWLPPHQPRWTVSLQVLQKASFLLLPVPRHSLVFFLLPKSSFRSLLKYHLLRVSLPDKPLMSASAPFSVTFTTLITVCSSLIVHVPVVCAHVWGDGISPPYYDINFTRSRTESVLFTTVFLVSNIVGAQ